MNRESVLRDPGHPGVLAALAASGAGLITSFGLTWWVINQIARQRGGVQPDFGSNGLNWFFVGAALFDGLFVVYVFVVFGIVIPTLFKRGQRKHMRPLNAPLITSGVLLPGVCLLVWCFSSPSPEDNMVGAALVGPLLVITGAASYWLLRQLNSVC